MSVGANNNNNNNGNGVCDTNRVNGGVNHGWWPGEGVGDGGWTGSFNAGVNDGCWSGEGVERGVGGWMGSYNGGCWSGEDVVAGAEVLVAVQMCDFDGTQRDNYFGGEPFGRAEVEVGASKLKNGKAAGEDEITGEMIKGGGDRVVDWIWRLCKMCFESA